MDIHYCWYQFSVSTSGWTQWSGRLFSVSWSCIRVYRMFDSLSSLIIGSWLVSYWILTSSQRYRVASGSSCWGWIQWWWRRASCPHWYIGGKLWPMPEHGSVLLYVHRNCKAHWDRKPRTATSTFTQLLNSGWIHTFRLLLYQSNNKIMKKWTNHFTV